MITPDHQKYATDRQWECCEAVIRLGTIAEAAREMNIKRQTIQNAIKAVKARAAKAGYSPEHNMTHTVPDGFRVKGTSTLYKDGQPVIQWVKSAIDAERQYELMQEAVRALCADVPRAEPVMVRSLERYQHDTMAVYPLGDPHIGMLSWADETGQDWDLEIAEDKFISVFNRLIAAAPRCNEAVIVNLGDYFHYDNMEGVTSRSGHSLDVDSRYAKMVRVGVRIMRAMIEYALGHHATVRVINVCGNHDDTSSIFLSVALANIYEREPRVIIDDSPTPYHYVKFGKCLIGAHHGHSTKMQNLPGIMATDRARDWGETEYRYWLTGHIHHDSMKEYPGCKVESFRTLAAKDAYATWGGYRAGQDSKCIVYHRDHGEIERHTVALGVVSG